MAKPKFDPNAAAMKFISAATAPTAPMKSKLIQKAYYITPEQYKQIRLNAIENNCDMSEVVRNALDCYFNKK